MAALSDLGRVGVWSRWLREADAKQRADGLGELEHLGYGTVWLPGMAGGDDLYSATEFALRNTERMVVATGILNIWGHDSREVATWASSLADQYPGRFLLGLGVSHSNLMPQTYAKPLDAMNTYLDVLDEYEGTSADRRILAALGPKMVEIARNRSLGVHPYNVTVAHTAQVRAALGPDPLVAPEQTVVLEDDPAIAMNLARSYYAQYAAFDNYANSFRRLGYLEEDLVPPGSERFLSDLVALGGNGEVAARVRQHINAGADHVCLQVWNEPVQPDAPSDPRPQLRRFAAALDSVLG